jgi:hypothetical protein
LPRAGIRKNYFFDLVVFLAAGFLAAFLAGAFFAMALLPPFWITNLVPEAKMVNNFF